MEELWKILKEKQDGQIKQGGKVEKSFYENI